jgi:hypothetical protein
MFGYQVKYIEEEALELYRSFGHSVAVAFVTVFLVEAPEDLHEKLTDFFGELFNRFRDFSTILQNTRGFTIESPYLTEQSNCQGSGASGLLHIKI